jgi:hypothetical protein
VGGADLGDHSSLRTILSGITDVASAKAALPKLQEVTGQIDKTDGMIGSLLADQRKVLAHLVNPVRPVVNELLDKAGDPGASERC